jgi:hypothetical protein
MRRRSSGRPVAKSIIDFIAMPDINMSRFDRAGTNRSVSGPMPVYSNVAITDRRDSTIRRPDDIPQEISSPRLHQLFDYWKSRRGGRAMPCRQDIEPYDIAAILPYVSITELHANPLRVRFRLAGSVIDELHGRTVTGQWLDDIEVLGGHDFWLGQYARLMREKAPIFGRTIGTYDGAAITRCDWILLPLSDDGREVDRCLELEDWDTRREQDSAEAGATRWQITVY